MRESKVSHKRLKSGRWSDVVTRYTFFLAGILCQIFALLLISVWKEFSEMTGSRYESLADLAAVVFVILLLIVWSMRWTYPMSIEEPIIIILIWIILSSRISDRHCFCCRGHRPGPIAPPLPHPNHTHHHHHHQVEVEEAGVAVVGAEHHHHHDGDHDEGPDMMLEVWQLLIDDCHLESFNFVYSLLCVILVLVAFCTELRNYYISLLFRLTTAALVAILLILLVVSPSLCSKFDISDSVITLARVTLFLAIGWINKYRRATERYVAHDYCEVVNVTTETLTLANTELPSYLMTNKFNTPRDLFLHFSRLARFLARQYNEDGGREKKSSKRRRKKGGGGKKSANDDDMDLPLGRAEIDDDGDEDEEDEEDEGRFSRRRDKEQSRLKVTTGERMMGSEEEEENVGETMSDILVHLYNFSNRYKQNYVSGVWCWKNRAHSKHLLHLIDLAYIIWLLIVCPQWLLLAPLEIVWLLYYVRLNTTELRETRKFVALQTAVLSKSTEFVISVG